MLPFDLSGMIWQIIAILEAMGFIIFILLLYFWVLPPISRHFRKAKWSGGVPAFIQDETGNVELCTSDKTYPEGVLHYKGKGWFLIPKRPYEKLEDMPNKERMKLKKRFIKVKTEKDGLDPEVALEQWNRLGIDANLSSEEKEQLNTAVRKLIHTPILKGLGKQVFFGSTDSVALSNLKTISEITNDVAVTDAIKSNPEKNVVEKVKLIMHANLRNCRLLAPIMYSKTQLDALATGNRLEGMKMFGKDATKIIIIAIAAACVIGSLGIVAWLLTN